MAITHIRYSPGHRRWEAKQFNRVYHKIGHKLARSWSLDHGGRQLCTHGGHTYRGTQSHELLRPGEAEDLEDSRACIARQDSIVDRT